MARNTKTIDLSAKLLGLEQTIEDDILDLMGSWVDDTANNVIDNFISNSKVASDRNKLEQFIRNIIYDELKNIFGDTFINRNNPKAFLTQLYFSLETAGFERNCRGCYYQVKNYGKIPHGKL
jgi:hypothetical protein